jgi:hypothetical protein
MRDALNDIVGESLVVENSPGSQVVRSFQTKPKYFRAKIATVFFIFVYAFFLSTDRPSSAQVTSNQLTVFDSASNACGPNDWPDQPARAYRDDKGLVHLFASHDVVRANLGASLLATTHRCAVVFQGNHKTDPASFDDYGWLAGFLTQDGKSVVAIVHNEFHGYEIHGDCPSGNPARCNEASITEAISTNGGQSFSRPKGDDALVAVMPYPYKPDTKTWFGFMNPTNIIWQNGYAYFMVSFIDPDVSKTSGVCLFRSATPANAKSWRGWDGHDYTVSFGNPYRTAGGLPKTPICAPVDSKNIMWSLGSLSWLPQSQIFVLTTRCQQWDQATRHCTAGAYVTASRDLLHWSTPVSLMADMPGPGGKPLAETYPSLMDPAATDRNFTDVTDTPWLFTVEIPPGHGGQERKLIARKVTLPVAKLVADLGAR